jgi:hypothetical protein
MQGERSLQQVDNGSRYGGEEAASTILSQHALRNDDGRVKCGGWLWCEVVEGPAGAGACRWWPWACCSTWCRWHPTWWSTPSLASPYLCFYHHQLLRHSLRFQPAHTVLARQAFYFLLTLFLFIGHLKSGFRSSDAASVECTSRLVHSIRFVLGLDVID